MPGRAGAEVALGPRAEMRPAALKKAGPMPNQFAIVSAWAGFVVVLLYANLFEYAFHRWLMHRLHRYISQPYETHVRLHHRSSAAISVTTSCASSIAASSSLSVGGAGDCGPPCSSPLGGAGRKRLALLLARPRRARLVLWALRIPALVHA